MNNPNDYEMDANKAKVYSKLDELKNVLNNAEKTSSYGRQPKEDAWFFDRNLVGG